jgi:hypothetical protein
MISEILKKNDSLIFLDMNKNKIASEGLKEFAESLEQNETLRALKLFWNDFNEESTEAFFNLLNKHRRKIKLDFGVVVDEMEFKLFKRKRYMLFEENLKFEDFLIEENRQDSDFLLSNFK